MKTKNITVMVLCLFALSLITACQPTEKIAIDDLYGVWVWDERGLFSFMYEDGTFLVAETNGPEFPVEFGQFSLEGTTLTYVMDEDSPSCTGTTIVVEAEFIEGDMYQETILDTDCEEGLDPGDTIIWIRHSP